MLTWKWNYRNRTKFIPVTCYLLVFDVSYIIIHHSLNEKNMLLHAKSRPHINGLLTGKESTALTCLGIGTIIALC